MSTGDALPPSRDFEPKRVGGRGPVLKNPFMRVPIWSNASELTTCALGVPPPVPPWTPEKSR
jgi:hypothetical protein